MILLTKFDGLATLRSPRIVDYTVDTDDAIVFSHQVSPDYVRRQIRWHLFFVSLGPVLLLLWYLNHTGVISVQMPRTFRFFLPAGAFFIVYGLIFVQYLRRQFKYSRSVRICQEGIEYQGRVYPRDRLNRMSIEIVDYSYLKRRSRFFDAIVFTLNDKYSFVVAADAIAEDIDRIQASLPFEIADIDGVIRLRGVL